ncbi:Gfo/Idh/MocA family protein [Ruminococcus albus]|uniref:Oxidoreductase domain protein n=1 Tax=Ruminococcus albus (strain ATCC 27210 / DSM 20455 / JCM 14654 / NCDO 2250 / 7) TaxID=697329 RepID=E6UDY4_RUMA7|nr:Gfo/Idh/MocA family oxidoreductase [Ruminococcus albus]ADU21771.1 oxidoreductase domain protein [Ruminococcus albus 7 = DSM 20455]
MNKIRLGIIGMGNMGSGHLRSIMKGESPRITVTAFADIVCEKLDKASEICPSAKAFDNAEEMLDSGLIDAALIAVPHYDHPKLAIECFKRGIHVMTEKPAGVYTRQVREMNEAAKAANVKFGIMFNQRTNPIYAKAREIVRSGQLGERKRLVWIVTNWYRTQAYYDSGSWRATWNGEGGGVLLNQAPHNLDLWQWIFGMPVSIRAFCTVGKYHNIGVEDDVTIYGEYENGATAVFISTTGEAPGSNRLEISGTKGKLVLEDGKLKWWKLKEDERVTCFNCKDGFVWPESDYEEFTAEEPDGHPLILNNFADAILDGAELIAPGEEGLSSLSISNAAYVSSWTDSKADIPVDEDTFEKHLSELCHSEKIEKKTVQVSESAEKLSERWKVRW